MMKITQKLKWFSATLDDRGILTLSSPSTITIELSASDSYELLQFLFSHQETLIAGQQREQREEGRQS